MSKYTAIPVAAPQPEVTMVQVIAPATLPEGYKFDAIYDGTTFSVTVPPGGIKEGQSFATPFTPQQQGGYSSGMGGDTDPLSGVDSAPTGHWKDGLCDCLKFGPIHPSFLNAWCCPQILMGQVLTRMKLDWLGQAASDEARKKTFRNVAVVVVSYWVLSTVFSVPSPTYEVDENGEFQQTSPPPSRFLVTMNNIINLGFSVYTIVVMIKLRRFIRARYQIPQDRCGGYEGCEDLCCVLFCGCCTVAQMARHTADYEDQRALCCSTTGLPATANIPVMVV